MAVSVKATGIIKQIFQTETKGQSNFKVREFVLETEDEKKYKEQLKISCYKDVCDQLNDFEVGQTVEVSINLRGKEWTNDNGKTSYFNTLQAYKIVSIS